MKSSLVTWSNSRTQARKDSLILVCCLFYSFLLLCLFQDCDCDRKRKLLTSFIFGFFLSACQLPRGEIFCPAFWCAVVLCCFVWFISQFTRIRYPTLCPPLWHNGHLSGHQSRTTRLLLNYLRCSLGTHLAPLFLADMSSGIAVLLPSGERRHGQNCRW